MSIKGPLKKSYPLAAEEDPQGRNVQSEDLPRQAAFSDAQRVKRCTILKKIAMSGLDNRPKKYCTYVFISTNLMDQNYVIFSLNNPTSANVFLNV